MRVGERVRMNDKLIIQFFLSFKSFKKGKKRDAF